MLALLALSVLDSGPSSAALLRALDLQDPPSSVPAQPSEWSFDFAPYYWSASVSGKVAIDGQDVELEGGDGFSGESTLIGFLGHFEAHHGPWSFVIAPMFINLDMQGGEPPNTDADLTLKAQVHEAFVAREFSAGWEWMIGARYQRLETDMDLSIGGVPLSTHESTRSWTDPIVGLRYHTAFDEHWSLFTRADIGGFGLGSDFAWNASALAHYQFTKLFGMYAGYRALSLDWEDLGPGGRTAYNLSMYGPIIGISFSL